MSDQQIQCEAPFEQLDIFVRRIFARFQDSDEQIVFGEALSGTTPIDIKEALKICVHNRVVNGTEYGVKCISDIKVVDLSADEEIICTHKVKFILRFKVVLFLTFENNSFECLVLPDDALSTNPDATACFITNIETTPQTIGSTEAFEIVTDSSGNTLFQWTKTVPLSEFEGEIPASILTDPTLQTHLLVKAITSDFDVVGSCTCGATPGTEVDFKVFADLLDKLGIDQDILICGVPSDL